MRIPKEAGILLSVTEYEISIVVANAITLSITNFNSELVSLLASKLHSAWPRYETISAGKKAMIFAAIKVKPTTFRSKKPVDTYTSSEHDPIMQKRSICLCHNLDFTG